MNGKIRKIVEHKPCKGCRFYDDDDTDMLGNVLCSVDCEVCKDSFENCNTMYCDKHGKPVGELKEFKILVVSKDTSFTADHLWENQTKLFDVNGNEVNIVDISEVS